MRGILTVNAGDLGPVGENAATDDSGTGKRLGSFTRNRLNGAAEGRSLAERRQ